MTQPDSPKILLIAGATGAVGSIVLKLALADPRIAKVVAPTRRPIGSQATAIEQGKLVNPVVDFRNLPSKADWWAVNSVVCALGTTIKKAGSTAEFRFADFELPLAMAQATKQHGADCYVLNSSAMASQRARGLYLKTKGDAEHAIRDLGFKSTVIARPGLLDAEREESRPAEKIGILVSRLINPVLPKRWRSVDVNTLARSMLEAAIAQAPGVTILESEEFQE